MIKNTTISLITTIFLGLILFAAPFLSYAQNQNSLKASGSNYAHRPGTKLRSEGTPLEAKIQGEGDIEVILLTGHSHGTYFYKSLVDRNSSRIKFHTISPPGMGNTNAYPWPEEPEEFLSRPWGRQLVKDLTSYIKKNCKTKPYLLAVWDSGLGNALHLANENPDLVKGLILIGKSPYYRWYRSEFNDTTLFDNKAQREVLVRFIDFWRTVDEYTWHSNTFKGSFYSKNDSLAQVLKYQEAKSPFVIGLRYFIEYMMDDLTELIANCSIPVLAIVPDAQTYTSPSPNSKRDFQVDSNKKIRLEFIPNVGLMVWEDDPEKFDNLFRDFVKWR